MVKNNTGFSNGTWKVSIIDATSKILIAQHTIALTGGLTPAPYPVYPGFTVEAWVKWINKPDISDPIPTNLENQTYTTIVINGDTNSNRQYQIEHDRLDLHFEVDFATVTQGSWGTWIFSTTQPVSGTWYYVTGVYNQTPGDVEIFVNGHLEASQHLDSSGLRSSTGPVQRGGPRGITFEGVANTRIFNGDIRGLNTYERAMGSPEVASRFAAGLPIS
ncbi:MAG: LamG-like jellyroll fold domain-containing protein [Methanomicrobiales archaeon]